MCCSSTGSLAVIWSAVWFCVVYDSPNVHPSLSEQERLIFDKDGSHVRLASAKVVRNYQNDVRLVYLQSVKTYHHINNQYFF
jgi:hypothetical protein